MQTPTVQNFYISRNVSVDIFDAHFPFQETYFDTEKSLYVSYTPVANNFASRSTFQTK